MEKTKAEYISKCCLLKFLPSMPRVKKLYGVTLYVKGDGEVGRKANRCFLSPVKCIVPQDNQTYMP